MVKTQYVDSDLLNEKISDSPLKIKELCETLGISRQAFDKKRLGITKFRQSEVFVMCSLLHINADEKSKIFYF